jgi:hypothetical protein
MEKKEFIDPTEPLPGFVRVSSILKSLNNYDGIDEAVLNRKKNIGSVLHNAIHAHSLGYFPLLAPEEVGYMQSFLKWIDLTGFDFVKCEIRLYDQKLKITGCIDAIITDPDTGKNFIVDFKTTAAANLNYWQHQGAFYHYLASLNSIEVGDEFRFVQLRKDGKLPRVHSFTMSELLWRHCLKLYYSYMSELKC